MYLTVLCEKSLARYKGMVSNLVDKSINGGLAWEGVSINNNANILIHLGSISVENFDLLDKAHPYYYDKVTHI